jgi:DNA-binding IclR family transcriptional regulator
MLARASVTGQMAQLGKLRKPKLTIDRGGAAAPKGNYAAPALEKAFDIIEFLGGIPGGATLNEVAKGLDRSIGELFRIIIVMERRGFLQKSPDTDRYTVAYKILDLAYRATPAQNLGRAATPVMQSLAAEIGQSCHLVVPNAGQGLVVVREENPGVRGFALRLGAPVDLIRSCSGHVILAFSEESQRQRLMNQAEQLTRTRLDRKKLESALRTVRKRGFDRRASAITHGVTDISFPVFDFYGNLMAALTVPFLELIDGSQKVGLAESTDHAAAAARSISTALGHHLP